MRKVISSIIRKVLILAAVSLVGSVAFFGFSPTKAVGESYIMAQDPNGGFGKVDPVSGQYTPIIQRSEVRTAGWSPNGRYFAFEEGLEASTTVRVYDTQNNQELGLLLPGRFESWHHDGRLIYKTGEDETNGYQYAAVNVQSGASTSFSYDTPLRSTHHAYSPDGTKLAYINMTAPESEEGGPAIIVIRNLANGQEQNVKEMSSGMARMSWSLDGEVLAFQFRNGWRHHIGVKTASGTVLDVTTDLPGSTTHFNPTLSPDGSEVVFARHVAATETEDSYYELVGRQLGFDTAGTARTIRTPYAPTGSDYSPDQHWRPVAEQAPDTDSDGTPDSTDECDNQPGPSSNAGCPIQLNFDWTAPDRLQANSSDLITNYPAIATQHPSLVINPTSGVLVDYPIKFHVTNDEGEPCDPSLTYTWKVNGTPVTTQQNGCDFTYTFTNEEIYSVTVEATDGQFDAIPYTGDVKINDHLIFSIGDSVASGEGNPHSQGVWAYAPCHRSAYAGAAQAALKLEREDNKSTVTFVHLACSGATAAHGVFGTYKGLGGQLGTPLPSQIQQIAMATGATADAQGVLQPKRKIDKLFMSIGANDIGFSAIARTCLTAEHCPTQILRTLQSSNTNNTYWQDIWGGDSEILPGDNLSMVVRKKLNKLPNGYRAIDACLGTGTTRAGCVVNSVFAANFNELINDSAYRNAMLQNAPVVMDSDDIVVTHYFDPTKHKVDGEIASCDPVIHFANQVLSKTEGEWASQFVLRGPNVAHKALNQHITDAGTLYGWRVISGIAEGFEPYGYCAGTSSWIVSIGEALLNSSGPAGALHPNEAGQAFYGDAMYETLPVPGNL